MTFDALFWHWLTRLGEAQILLPLVLLACAWLWLGARRGGLALRWLACIGLAAALTTVTKLAFIGWEWGSADWDFTGISGHAMFSAACLPMLAWVLLRGRDPAAQHLGVVSAFVLAGLIAYSRLEVHAHSPSEAATGFALGAAAAAVSLRGLLDTNTAEDGPNVPLWLPACVCACLLLLPGGAPRSRTHDWVTAIAVQLSGRDQPFRRHDLHRKHLQPLPLKALI